MGSLAVFGYGSLVDRRSASLTLGREVERIWPARLPGWRRRFSQARENRRCEKTFADVRTEAVPEWILGLNLERSDEVDLAPNGGLIELDPGELDRLDLREIRYDRADVGAELRPGPGTPRFDRVVTYTARQGHLAPEPPPGAVILRSYAETVERAFDGFAPGELDEYRRTTLPYPVELIDGRLVRDAIPEGNPREW